MQDLTWEQWDAKSRYRSIHNVVPEKINMALECYGSKIPHLERMLIEERGKFTELLRIVRAEEATLDGLEEIANLTRKINRLKDKRITCEKELEGRDLGTIIRDFKDFHFTDYYIDLDAGNDGNGGEAFGDAWLTLAQYTTTTVRTAGDRAFVRANTDEGMAITLNCDENGTQDAYIEIIGCDSVTNDPWSDGGDVKPILTFGDNAALWQFNGDLYWKTTRLVVKEANSSSGNVNLSTCISNVFIDCEFTDNANANGRGAYVSTGSYATFIGCVFKDNLLRNFQAYRSSYINFQSCTFDGGGETTDYGIYLVRTGNVEAIDCSFGQTTAHDVDDIHVTSGSEIKLRNCNTTRAEMTVAENGGAIFEEDADATYGAGFITYYEGTVEKDAGVTTGNANFSFKMLPNTNVGPNTMLTLNNDSIIDYPFVTYHAGGSEVTLTIKIKACGTWGSYPTAAQLYMKTWYLDHATNATRSVDVSTEVLSDGNWTSFTTTFTPAQAGLAYTEIRLGVYEDAGDGVEVNGEIVAS